MTSNREILERLDDLEELTEGCLETTRAILDEFEK